MIEDRIYNRNITSNQQFFTGMFNINNDRTLYENFLKLFQGGYNIDDVMKLGRNLLDSQMNIVKERIIKNSKVVKLEDGTEAVLTEAS